MILNKIVKVKINKKNINHYSNFFENLILRDIINVRIEDQLTKGSNMKIDVQCDICSTKRNISFQNYNKNINSSEDYPIYTCDKCSHIKIKNSNKKKYGVEYYSQTKEYAKKFKSTMVERYGVEHALQNKELFEKKNKTNMENYGIENPFMDSDNIKNRFMEKYGVDSPIKVPEIKERIKSTMVKRYGVEWSLQSDIIREKASNTMLKKYGYTSYSKTDEFKTKLINKNLEKYGVEWIFQDNEFKEKSKKSMMEKYGSNHPMKSEIIRHNFIISNNINYIKYIDNEISLFKCDCGENHEFEIDIDTYHNRKRSSLCTICNPIGNSSSIKQKDLINFIKTVYFGNIIDNYRNGIEIDIYLPELNLGFEFNGLYWHSEKYRERNYHIDKQNYFKERGIRIIYIWEDDWDNRRDIIKSQIRNWVGSTPNRIYARKCKIKEVSAKESSTFLNENHVQGYNRNQIKIGLFNNNELLSLMTFNKFEGRKKLKDNEWNLSRFCNKLNTNVIGGASKLLKHFIKKYNPNRIISYVDKDWSSGELYEKLEFDKLYDTKPDYKYLINNKRIHKQNFKSISKNMINYSKIWDCGKIKYEIKKS